MPLGTALGTVKPWLVVPAVRMTMSDTVQAPTLRTEVEDSGQASDSYHGAPWLVFNRVNFGRATRLVSVMPGSLRDRFSLGLIQIAALSPEERSLAVERALAPLKEEVSGVAYRKTLASLPPFQPDLRSRVTAYQQFVESFRRDGFLAGAALKFGGVAGTKSCRADRGPQYKHYSGDFSIGTDPSFYWEEMSDYQDAAGDLVNGLSVAETIQLVLLIWAWACDNELPPEARVCPSVELAAYWLGLAPLRQLTPVSGSSTKSWYGTVKLRTSGSKAIPAGNIDDVMIVLDIILENLLRLDDYEFDGYPMGRALADAFRATGGYSATTIEFDSAESGYGFQTGTKIVLGTNSWTVGTRTASILVNNNFRRGFAANQGECGALELRQLMVTILHEMTHRVFYHRWMCSGYDPVWCPNQQECDGPSFWSAPTGTNHHYCEWVASDFTDRIWPPALAYDPSGGGENQDDFNQVTAREWSACRCTKTASDRALYGGGQPDLGDLDTGNGADC